jgi:hypothetical protein
LAELVPAEKEAAEDDGDGNEKDDADGAASAAGSMGPADGSGGGGGGCGGTNTTKKVPRNKYAAAIAQLHCHTVPTTPTAIPQKDKGGTGTGGAAEESSMAAAAHEFTEAAAGGGGGTAALPPLDLGASAAAHAPAAGAGAADAYTALAHAPLPASPVRRPLLRPPAPGSGVQRRSANAAGSGTPFSSARRPGANGLPPPAARLPGPVAVADAVRRGPEAAVETGFDPLLALAWALGLAAAGLVGRKALRIVMLSFFDLPLSW